MPNDATTAVWTGSPSRRATTAARSGCASVVASALSMTSAATLSSAIQIARGTWRAASRVSSDTPTQASKPMNTQPPTASAASNDALTEPPDSACAPSVSPRTDRSCVRKASSSATPTPIEATTSAAIPTLIARPSSLTPNAPAAAQATTRIMPATTMRLGLGVTSTSASAQGAPRYATVVFAAAYAQIATQPLNQP